MNVRRLVLALVALVAMFAGTSNAEAQYRHHHYHRHYHRYRHCWYRHGRRVCR